MCKYATEDSVLGVNLLRVRAKKPTCWKHKLGCSRQARAAQANHSGGRSLSLHTAECRTDQERRPEGPAALAAGLQRSVSAVLGSCPAPHGQLQFQCAVLGLAHTTYIPRSKHRLVSIQVVRVSCCLSQSVDSAHICTSSAQRGAYERGSQGSRGARLKLLSNFLESLSFEKRLELASEAPLLRHAAWRPPGRAWVTGGLTVSCSTMQHTCCIRISPTPLL